MRTRYKILESEHPYFITCTTIEWIPIFTRKPYFDILINTLNYCRQHKGLKIYAYVILDNHLHMIVVAEHLSKIIKEFKSHTAREIVRVAQEEDKGWLLSQLKFHKYEHKKESRHQVWQEGFHPKMIVSDDMFRQKADYIHHNPVRIGIVDQPEDWLYYSARNYFDLPGPLEIDLIEM